MRYLSNSICQTLQACINKHPGIAAAENHFINGGVLFDLRKSGLPVFFALGDFVIRIKAAKAVAAMDGTNAGDNQERPGGILLQKARRDQGGLIAHRILGKSIVGLLLLCEGKHLLEQGMLWISGGNFSQIFPRHKQAKMCRGPLGRCTVAGGKPERLAKFLRRANRTPHRLLPTIACKRL